MYRSWSPGGDIGKASTLVWSEVEPRCPALYAGRVLGGAHH